jgi:hypothetical protein
LPCWQRARLADLPSAISHFHLPPALFLLPSPRYSSLTVGSPDSSPVCLSVCLTDSCRQHALDVFAKAWLLCQSGTSSSSTAARCRHQGCMRQCFHAATETDHSHVACRSKHVGRRCHRRELCLSQPRPVPIRPLLRCSRRCPPLSHHHARACGESTDQAHGAERLTELRRIERCRQRIERRCWPRRPLEK